jgi:hypothetical protein
MALPLISAKNGEKTQIIYFRPKMAKITDNFFACTQGAQVFFFPFWGRWGVLDFCCFQWVP